MTAWNPSLLELLDYGDGNAVIQTTSLAPLSKVAPQKPLKFMVGSSFSKADCFCSFPDFMAKVMHFGPLNAQASGFLRLVGMLVSGFGVLYVLSGRLNAEGLCLRNVDRSAIRRSDDGCAVVLWRFTRSARAAICHRRFR